MKSLHSLLFVLVIPVAACSGSNDASSASSSGEPTSKLPSMTATKPDAMDPVAVVDKQPDSIIKSDEPLTIPTKFSDAMALGKALVTKGDHSRAKEVLEAASKMDKKSAEPHVELARMYIATNERSLAIRSANKAIKLAPSSSQAYNTLGRAELARFDYDKAIEAFRKATDLNPNNVWAWNNLGFTHLQLEHYPEAIEALSIATEKKDATGYMFNNLGTAHEHLDQLDEAREAFEKGGKLGSVAAMQSRKRLEGVDSIAMYKEAKESKVEEKTYENAEPMPEDVEPMVEDRQTGEEPAVVEPKPEAKVETVDDEPKDETPAAPAPATT
ncbi:MAG: tetratricopeptide repeat protein [Deltaproteobacteria bacterium]|nr:tetratricopeptide repeat protein [Deltaproteobacteria bacterium]